MVSCLSSCPWEAEELSKVQLQQTKLLQVWNHLFWKLLSLGNKNICTRQPPLHVLLRKKICQGHQSSLLSKTQKGWITCKRVFFGDCFKKIYICMYSYVFVFMWKKKKNLQPKNGELSFIWGRMKTIARETASQITVRNCSEEVGEGHCMWFPWRGCLHLSTHFGRQLLLVTRSRYLH